MGQPQQNQGEQSMNNMQRPRPPFLPNATSYWRRASRLLQAISMATAMTERLKK